MKRETRDNIFKTYTLLMEASGTMHAVSDIRVGKGKEQSILEADLPVVKNIEGVPVIPGSTLKGFFRGTAARILTSKQDEKSISALLDEIFGGADESSHASSVQFGQMVGSSRLVMIRKHIKIDPRKQAVENLFEVEYAPAGVDFIGLLFTIRNTSPLYLGLFGAVIKLANDSLVKIGGFKSRGYGSMRFRIEKLDFILPGKSLTQQGGKIDVQTTVPCTQSVQFVLGEKTISLGFFSNDEDLGNVEVVPGKIAKEPLYFGTRISITDPPSIEKFLGDCIAIIEKKHRSLLAIS